MRVELEAPVSPDRFQIGSVAIDRVTLGGALDRIEALVCGGTGGAVFTPNVDHVVMAERDQSFREAYAGADLVLADGTPIVWSSRLLGGGLPERVSGADLVRPLCSRAAERGWSVYLLGGMPGVAAAAAAQLVREMPRLRIAGTDAPTVRAAGHDPEGEAAAERLRSARPALVLVAFGAPKQELWIARNLPLLRPAVMVGVGAALDFIAGRVRRAPAWMSRVGLEWAWRLGREPRRLWRRYLVDDPKFVGILARSAFRGSRTRDPNVQDRRDR